MNDYIETFKDMLNEIKELRDENAHLRAELQLREVDWKTVLLPIYKQDYKSAAIVAQICDEVLDKSGKLLGEIRLLSLGLME